jgi:hypothetical protein
MPTTILQSFWPPDPPTGLLIGRLLHSEPLPGILSAMKIFGNLQLRHEHRQVWQVVGWHDSERHQGISRSLLCRRIWLSSVPTSQMQLRRRGSSFLPMTMKVAPSEYARLVPQSISSATVKNIGPSRHPKSGSASSVARGAPMSESAFRSTMTARFAGFISESVALPVAFWVASPDGRSPILRPSNC